MKEQKKILITGSAGTIGSALADFLADAEVKIALHYNKSAGKVETLARDIRNRVSEVFTFQADLSSVKAAENLIAEADKKLDGLNVLIHTASVFERTPLGSVTEEQWDRIIEADLKSVFFLAQAAGLAMQRAGGKIFLFSDVAGIRPYAGYLPYCISKAGVNSLVKGLAKSLAPKVQVNAVAPYVVTRPEGLSDKGWNDILSKMPMKKATTVKEISSIVKTLIYSTESVTGQIIVLDGGRLL